MSKELTYPGGGHSAKELDSMLRASGDGEILKALRGGDTVEKVTITQETTDAAVLTSADRLFRENLLAPALMLKEAAAPMYMELPKPFEAGCDLSWKIVDNWKNAGRATISKDDCGIGTTVSHDTQTVLTSMTSVRNNSHVSDCNVRISSNFDDLLALGKLLTTMPHMEALEGLIWGGQIAALAAPLNPAGVAAATGSALTGAQTLLVTALTWEGYQESLVAGYNQAGYTGPRNGESVVSAAAGPVGVAGDTITWTWDDVPGAVAYNLYANNLYLATVGVTTFAQTADAPGTNLADPVADTSADANAFAGILSYLIQFGATSQDLDGAALTASAGGASIGEWETIFRTIYANDKTGPEEIWMSPAVGFDVYNKIMSTGSPQIQYMVEPGSGSFVGGGFPAGVRNPMTGDLVRLRIHPNFPTGLVIGLRRSSPFGSSRLAGASIDLPGVAHMEVMDLARTDACLRWFVESCLTLRFKSTLGSFYMKNVGT